MRINLTQHEARPAQECAPRDAETAKAIRQLLTISELPDAAELARRATALVDIAADSGATEAMIGGAAYLMLFLDPQLRMRQIQPLYAFAPRVVEEQEQADGSIKKVSVFKHGAS